MKNFDIKKEILIWIIVILPIIYLASVWNSLPEIVPTHFDLNGKPNDWSHKWVLIIIVLGMNIGVYSLLTFIPMIDPKKQFEKMGSKYFKLKLFFQIILGAISVVCVQLSFKSDSNHVDIMFVLVGGLFMFLGNYFQAIKPNYFIGIRTPWTLENENVWRKTHQLGGKLFFIAGLLIMILPFVLHQHFHEIFLTIIFSAALIPVIYSYILSKQEEKTIKN